MNFLFRMVQTAEDEIRRSAWAESNRQEPLWPSINPRTTREDVKALQQRIIHGLPKLPMAGWRW